MTNVNFFYPEIFERKFKRSPKFWSLDELHDLYLRTKSRADKHHEKTKFIMDRIENEIPKFNNKSKVYFYQVNNDQTYLRNYEFNWRSLYNKYTSYSIGDPKLDNREERLDFLIANKLSFELGQEFYELKKIEDMAWRTMWKVKSIFLQVLDKKLREKYDGKIPPKTLILDISGYKYFIHVDDEYHYPKFTMENEFDGNIVQL